jgi:hypothetical protein
MQFSLARVPLSAALLLQAASLPTTWCVQLTCVDGACVVVPAPNDLSHHPTHPNAFPPFLRILQGLVSDATPWLRALMPTWYRDCSIFLWCHLRGLRAPLRLSAFVTRARLQGKTLQGITLLWTLLSARGHPLLGGEPIAKRVIICCPTSLVG